MVLPTKPNGEHPLCIDNRKLNAVTEFQAQPLSEQNHLFARLNQANFFQGDRCEQRVLLDIYQTRKRHLY